MKYNDCLQELDHINLKADFLKEVEPLFDYIEYIKKTDEIHSTASLIKYALNLINNKSIIDKWSKVLHYFLTPSFARKLNFLQ